MIEYKGEKYIILEELESYFKCKKKNPSPLEKASGIVFYIKKGNIVKEKYPCSDIREVPFSACFVFKDRTERVTFLKGEDIFKLREWFTNLLEELKIAYKLETSRGDEDASLRVVGSGEDEA